MVTFTSVFDSFPRLVFARKGGRLEQVWWVWPIRQQARKQDVACGGRTHPGVALELHCNTHNTHTHTPHPPLLLIFLLLLLHTQTNKPTTTAGLCGTRHHFTAQLRDSGMQHTRDGHTLSMRIWIVVESHRLKTIWSAYLGILQAKVVSLWWWCITV